MSHPAHVHSHCGRTPLCPFQSCWLCPPCTTTAWPRARLLASVFHPHNGVILQGGSAHELMVSWSCTPIPAGKLPSSGVQRGPPQPSLRARIACWAPGQAGPAFTRGCGSIPMPLLASAFLWRRTPSLADPRPVCQERHPGLSHPTVSAGDGRPTIAHKRRMSPQSLPSARLRGNLPRERRAPPDVRRPMSFVLLTLACSEWHAALRVPRDSWCHPPVLGEEEEEGCAAAGLTVPLHPQGRAGPVPAPSLGCGMGGWHRGWCCRVGLRVGNKE